jgi:prepilin-type N-terminal cleavage/methylation domain-containing protein
MNKLVELRKKLKNKKGFTLMEMLIVVAIIVILLAIAIPSFNNSLNKAKTTADEANVRSYYAEIMVKNMTEKDPTLPSTDIKEAMKTAGYELQAKGADVTASGATVDEFKLTYTNDSGANFVVGGDHK